LEQLIVLFLSGSATQAMVSSSNLIETNTVFDYFVEEMTVIAGIDESALVKLHLLGGDSPLKVSSTLFDDVKSWGFIVSDQQDYASYLLRRPFKAPDNATLVLEMDSSLGQDGSLNASLDIAALFDAHYDIELHWAGAAATKEGNYVYVFSSGSGVAQIEALVNEIKTDVTTGFADAIETAAVVDSPVKAVFIGEERRNEVVSFRGVYYVDPDAIAELDGEYTLSTNSIFGKDLGVYSKLGVEKYSVLKFRFPYLINAKAINPMPNNVAPQISGKMDWYMQLP